VNDDERLRDRFRAADRAQRAQAPPFADLLRRERPVRPRRFLVLAAAASILLAAIVADFLRESRPAPPRPDPFYSSARWKGPTDFLLETPGDELLHAIPRIGAPPTPEDGSPEPEKGTRT
jgi:hypothetical protein